jgi:hypothetical protein
MALAMEKIEKRLTDLSGALAHNYPEIKLTKCRNGLLPFDRQQPATGKSGNKISFLYYEVKSRMRSTGKISPDFLNIFQ